jgi:hypothetical protein
MDADSFEISGIMLNERKIHYKRNFLCAFFMQKDALIECVASVQALIARPTSLRQPSRRLPLLLLRHGIFPGLRQLRLHNLLRHGRFCGQYSADPAL